MPHMKIGIVTDSTADIPKEIQERYNIAVIPAVLMINGQSYLDGHGISREEFYRLLPSLNSPPTTATPSLLAFKNIYAKLFDNGFQHIISIHAAQTLSGIYNTALSVAQSFQDQITVLDSQSLSLGLGYQVIHAAEMIKKEIPLEKIIASIKNIQSRIRVFAMLDTLEFVRRSGRVSWARSRIGTLLNIKPLIELRDGKVLSIGQRRTREKGIHALKEILLSLGSIERLAILHSNAEKDALQFQRDVQHNYHFAPIIANVTTIIGTHVGPNGLGFAAVIDKS